MMRRFLKCSRGNAAVETALCAAILMPACLYGGQHVGPPIRDWAQSVYAETVAAQTALIELCTAMETAEIESEACPVEEIDE